MGTDCEFAVVGTDCKSALFGHGLQIRTRTKKGQTKSLSLIFIKSVVITPLLSLLILFQEFL